VGFFAGLVVALALSAVLVVAALLALRDGELWPNLFILCGLACLVGTLFIPFFLIPMFFQFLALGIVGAILRSTPERLRWPALPVLCAVSVAVYAGYWLWLPNDVRYYFDDNGPAMDSRSKLKGIVIGFHNYHDANDRHLPPAVVTDKTGRPLYSWRVAILPYLDEEKELAAKFHFDEPWDSAHNKPLVARTPHAYRSPLLSPGDDDGGLTFYQAIVGPGTALEPPGLTLANDFPNGLGNIFLVVEAEEQVPWAKPGDLVYDPQGPLPKFGRWFTWPIFRWKLVIGERPRFQAAMADGSVRGFAVPYDEVEIRAFMVRSASESRAKR
jgi:hypothetical protein